MKKVYERMDYLSAMKEKEERLAKDKIEAAKKELEKAKKSGKTDSERILEFEKKIKANEELSKELIKEIKQLKKVHHENGNELFGLDISEQYPGKINQL